MSFDNRCIVCNINMGETNPRQYCGKTKCDNEWMFEEDLFGEDDTVEEEQVEEEQVEEEPVVEEPVVKDNIKDVEIDFDNKEQVMKGYENIKIVEEDKGDKGDKDK